MMEKPDIAAHLAAWNQTPERRRAAMAADVQSARQPLFSLIDTYVEALRGGLPAECVVVHLAPGADNGRMLALALVMVAEQRIRDTDRADVLVSLWRDHDEARHMPADVDVREDDERARDEALAELMDQVLQVLGIDRPYPEPDGLV